VKTEFVSKNNNNGEITPAFPRSDIPTVAESQYLVNCGTDLYQVEKSFDIV
jgi:hypothetical protein